MYTAEYVAPNGLPDFILPDPNNDALRKFLDFDDDGVAKLKKEAIDYYLDRFGIDFRGQPGDDKNAIKSKDGNFVVFPSLVKPGPYKLVSDSKKVRRCPVIIRDGSWTVVLAPGVKTALVRGTYGGPKGLPFNMGDALAYGFYGLPGFFRHRRRSTLKIKFLSILPIRANSIDTAELKGRCRLISKEFGEGEATITFSVRKSSAGMQIVGIRNALTFPSQCIV